MKNKIKRIKPPKFKVGRYVLNEYELRCLQVEVAKGDRDGGIMVREQSGESAIILDDGTLNIPLKGYQIASTFSLELLRINREKRLTGEGCP